MRRKLNLISTKFQRRAKAFTITEVVVASGLLIITIVPILRGLTNININSVMIEHKTQSLLRAQSKLDEIKAASIYGYDNSFTENNASLGNSYFCNIVDTAQSSDLRKITVSAGYDTDENSTLSENEVLLSLSTLLARRW